MVDDDSAGGDVIAVVAVWIWSEIVIVRIGHLVESEPGGLINDGDVERAPVSGGDVTLRKADCVVVVDVSLDE